MGVLSGLFHDAYGPRRTVLFGATLHCVGYFGLYTLCGDTWRSRVPVWQPALLLGLAANGAGFIDMGCLMTMLHNAGAERALMAGVAKALLGLCGSVFTAIYIAFIKPDARDFLLLLAATPLLVGARPGGGSCSRLRSHLTRLLLHTASFAAPFLERLPREDLHVARANPSRASTLWALGVWVCSLCVYLFLSNALLLSRTDAGRLWTGVTVGLLILLVAPPLLLLFAGLPLRAGTVPSSAGDDDSALASHGDRDEDSAPPPPRLRGQRTSELTVGQCMHCIEFWLLFWALAAGAGGALVLVNNLAQVASSVGSSAEPASLVALFSVCNAAGRLAMGAVGSLPVPRPAFLVGSLAVMAATLLSLTAGTPGALYIAVALVGVCFGSFWTFCPVVVTELFGEKHSGAIYGAVGTSPAVGSFFLNTLMAGRVYDAHARMPPPTPAGDPQGATCTGKACFRLTFQACSGASLAGMVLAFVLLRRTRHMYKRSGAP